MQASYSPLRPDHMVQHANMAIVALPDATRQTATHAADCYAGTGGPGAKAAGTDLTLLFPGVSNSRLVAATSRCTLLTRDDGFSKAAIFS